MELAVTEQPPAGFEKFVSDVLTEFNAGRAGGWKGLNIALPGAREGEFSGGILARTGHGHLHVRYLAIAEPIRGRGFGRRLMRMAEEEAVRRGCHAAWLHTLSFQARPFYERLGYAVFGTLGDYPPGHAAYFMRKALS